MTHFFNYLFILYVAHGFLSIYSFSVPFIAFPSHSKTSKINKSKIQTPKPRSKSASALGQTQKLRPERLTIDFDEKIGLIASCFFSFFSCHQSCVAFFCGFIGFPITSQNAKKKKSREFPLGGPSPCGKQD